MNKRTLLLATAGGHIDELFELADRFCRVGEDRLWVTSATPQTTSLLAGEQVAWVRPVGSRQAIAALKSLPQAWSLLRRHRPGRIVTTGAAMAVPYLLLARLQRINCVYIESATRLYCPSITGRLAEALPGVELHTQIASWSRRRWQLIAGVFDDYVVEDHPSPDSTRVLVTVGTERFPFNRAIDAMRAATTEDSQVVWQTGHTPVAFSLPGTHRPWWPAQELRELAADSGVIVTHAGVGSILMALRAGKCPVVLPRTGVRGEHVDEHQVELARVLAERNLAIVAQPGDDLGPLITEAARYTIRHRIRSLP